MNVITVGDMKVLEHPQGVEVRYLLEDGQAIISDMLVWAYDNCQSYTKNKGSVDYATRELVYIFLITDKKDVVHFLLKWAR